MFCEADAAAQGIFTGELRLTEGSCTSNSKVPRAQCQQPIGALTTDMSPLISHHLLLTAQHA